MSETDRSLTGPLWTGLLHLAPGQQVGRTGWPEHLDTLRRLHSEPDGAQLGSVVCADQELNALDRAVAESTGSRSGSGSGDGRLPVTAVNTSGAGGLVALAGRQFGHLQIVSAVSALRDLDDLAGNAARVVAAADALQQEAEEEVAVYVEIPWAFGWERAVEEIEIGSLFAAVRPAGAAGATRDAAMLSGLIEADLPFRVLEPTDRSDADLPGLLAAIDLLIDDADVPAAAAVLSEEADSGRTITWDEPRQLRVRRRLHGVHCSPAALARWSGRR